jgi:hypothetical protein
VGNRDDGDLQNSVVNFVNNSVVADTNSPGVSVGQFFATGRPRVSLQNYQFVQNSRMDIVAESGELLLNRFGEDDRVSHFTCGGDSSIDPV